MEIPRKLPKRNRQLTMKMSGEQQACQSSHELQEHFSALLPSYIYAGIIHNTHSFPPCFPKLKVFSDAV